MPEIKVSDLPDYETPDSNDYVLVLEQSNSTPTTYKTYKTEVSSLLTSDVFSDRIEQGVITQIGSLNDIVGRLTYNTSLNQIILASNSEFLVNDPRVYQEDGNGNVITYAHEYSVVPKKYVDAQDTSNKSYLEGLINAKASIAGPTFTGTVTLDPAQDTANNDSASSTGYVRSYVSSQNFISSSGATITGILYINATPTTGTMAANKAYVDATVATGVTGATTDDIPEGLTNLYYTNNRFDLALGGKTTTDLAEGTNLYYTDARADTRATLRITAADIGNLNNVDETGVADGKILKYSSTSSKWEIADNFDGDYANLINKPTIPALLTDLGIVDGTNGQVLTTDGSGNFTFTTVSGGGGGTAYDQSLNTTDDVAFNKVTTDELAFSGTGSVTFTSANNLAFVAPGTITFNGAQLVSSLNDFSNVNVSSATNGQVIVYDTSSSEWIADSLGINKLDHVIEPLPVSAPGGTDAPVHGSIMVYDVDTTDGDMFRYQTVQGAVENALNIDANSPNKVLGWTTGNTFEWVSPSGMSNIADAGYGVDVTGKIATTDGIDIDIGGNINAAGTSIDFQNATISFSGASIGGLNSSDVNLANIQDETYGVSVTGKMAIDTIDIGSGINASPGATFDLQGTTINFGSATIMGGNAFSDTINNHLWSGATAPTDGYVLSWNTSLLSGAGDYEWVAQSAEYADSDVDTHLNTSTATSGQVLSWTGTDYDWVTGGGGTYGDTNVASYLNGNLDTHIIPDTNAAYDLGNAEYKIRHLFLSDNSIKMGDNEVSIGLTNDKLTVGGSHVSESSYSMADTPGAIDITKRHHFKTPGTNYTLEDGTYIGQELFFWSSGIGTGYCDIIVANAKWTVAGDVTTLETSFTWRLNGTSEADNRTFMAVWDGVGWCLGGGTAGV